MPSSKQADLIRRVFPAGVAQRIIDAHFPQGDDLLVNSDAFFRPRLREGIPFHYRSKLVGRQDLLRRLHEFVESERERVLIMWALGGMGKTRLMLEFANEFSSRHESKELWFVNEIRIDDGAEALGTASEGELVVVQDDAHRVENVRVDLLKRLAELKGKVIFATRPGAVTSLRDRVMEAGISVSEIEEVDEFPALSNGQMTSLAEDALDEAFQHHRERLVELSGGCPLLVTVGAALINSGELDLERPIQTKSFQLEVFSRLERGEFERIGGDAKTLRRVLACVAISSPWNRETGLDGLSEMLGYTPGQLRDYLDHLEAGSLTVKSGKGWRVTPDRYSDYLVWSSCFDDKGRLTDLARQFQKRYATTPGAEMMRNLAEAEWQSGQSGRGDDSLLEPFWRELLSRFDSSDFVTRGQIVSDWTALAAMQPSRSLELARRAVELEEAPGRDRSTQNYFASMCSHSAVLAKVAALLSNIGLADSVYHLAVFDLLWKIQTHPNAPSGYYRDRAINEIVAVGSIRDPNDVQPSSNLLEWIEGLLEREGSVEFFELSNSWLSTILKPMFEQTIGDIVLVDGHGKQVLRWIDSERSGLIRKRVYKLLETNFIPYSEIAAIRALPVLGQAMREGAHFARWKNYRNSKDEWLEERGRILNLLGSAFKAYSTPRIAFEVERLLRNLRLGESASELREMIGSLRDHPRLRWHRSVCSNLADEFYRESKRMGSSDSIESARGKWKSLVDQVVGDLLAAYADDAALIDELEERLKDHRLFGESPRLDEVLTRLAVVSPERGMSIATRLLAVSNSPLDREWLSFVNTDYFFPNKEFSRLCLLVLRGSNLERQKELLGLLFALREPELIPDDIVAELRDWARSASGAQIDLIIEAMRWSSKGDLSYRSLLESMDLDTFSNSQVGDLADKLGWMVVADGDDAGVAEPLVETLLNRMLSLPSLEFEGANGESKDLVKYLVKRFPERMYRFFERRIAQAESFAKADTDYFPLPRKTDWVLRGFEKSESFEEIGEQLRGRFLNSKEKESMYWRTLYQWAILRIDSGEWARLLELVKDGLTRIRLERIIDCVRFRGSLVIFERPELTKAILRAIKRLAPEDSESLRYRLASSARGEIREWTSGELDEKYRFFGDEAKKAATRFAEDEELLGFYRMIIEWEEADAQRHRTWSKIALAEAGITES